MKKQLVIIGIVALLVTVGLSGCEQINLGKKNISVIIGEPYLDNTFLPLKIPITLQGDSANYHLMLSGPEKTTVGETVILENQMLDGAEPKELQIGEPFYSSGSPKEFTLIITTFSTSGDSENEVYRTTLSFYGANISIVNCSAPLWNYNWAYEKYDLDTFYLMIENSGDLPIEIKTGAVKVKVGDVEYISSIFEKEGIEFKPGEPMEEFLSGFWSSSKGISAHGNKLYLFYENGPGISLDGGENIMTIEIYDGKQLLTTFSTTVEIS